MIVPEGDTAKSSKKKNKSASAGKKHKSVDDSSTTDKPEDVAKELFGFSDTSCHNCGISNEDIGGFLLQCASCKKAYYCGMACFNDNLPLHMKFCRTNQLESEPRGRRDALKKTIVPPPPEEPAKEKALSSDSCKTKKKASKGERKPKVTGNAQRAKATVKKVFIDSSCSDSEYETESESNSERTKLGRPPSSTTAPETDSAVTNGGDASSASISALQPVVDAAAATVEENEDMRSDVITTTLVLVPEATPVEDGQTLPFNDQQLEKADTVSPTHNIKPPLKSEMESHQRDCGSDAVATVVSTESPLDVTIAESSPTASSAEDNDIEETRRSCRGGGLVGSVTVSDSCGVECTTTRNQGARPEDEQSAVTKGTRIPRQVVPNEAMQRASSMVLRSTTQNKTSVEWSRPDWTETQLQSSKSTTSTDEAINEAAMDSRQEQSRLTVEDAGVESQGATKTRNGEQEEDDVEETRQRRGGGIVRHARADDLTVKRASSLRMRAFNDDNTQMSRVNTVEWTDNQVSAWKMAAAEAKRESQSDKDLNHVNRDMDVVNSETIVRSALSEWDSSDDEEIEETRKRRGGGAIANRPVVDLTTKRATSFTLRSENAIQSERADHHVNTGAEAAVSSSSLNEGNLSDDEDIEETRKRRGGGVLSKQGMAESNMKRASSLTLRSAKTSPTESNNQAELSDRNFTQLQAWRSAALDINNEFEKTFDGDESEESRRRCGGSRIHGQSGAVMTRSSSVVLRNTTQNKAVVEWGKPEWASSQLRATQQGEAIKNLGTLSANVSRRDMQPVWISQRKLRSTSDRDLSRQAELDGQSKCICTHEECNDTEKEPGSKRDMLRKCQSCRLNGEAQILPDIVRRAQNLRKEKSSSNMARIE